MVKLAYPVGQSQSVRHLGGQLSRLHHPLEEPCLQTSQVLAAKASLTSKDWLSCCPFYVAYGSQHACEDDMYCSVRSYPGLGAGRFQSCPDFPMCMIFDRLGILTLTLPASQGNING